MTTNELIKCATRELGSRERVYPKLVRSGRMSQKKADNEIQAMKEIRDLLAAKEEAETPRLL